VAENLLVYGQVYGSSAGGPTVERGDVTMEASDDVSLGYAGLAAGLAYYFMPINLYVGGSIGFVGLTVEDTTTGTTGESDTGLGLDLMVGKEFWVGGEWGLGAAGQIILGTVPDGEDVSFGVFGVGIHFSATYN